MDEKRETPGRIPVRFVDDEAGRGRGPSGEGDDAPSAEEIGRASIYEDETEVQRRIDRGAERDTGRGRDRADDADTAGGPLPSDLPERREDQDTNLHAAEVEVIEATPDYDEINRPRPAAEERPTLDTPAGPALAELLATRAELRRVEGQLKKVEEERAAERQELLDLLARRQADFENYRKRVERERGEIYTRTLGEVAGHLLPIMDNLARAVESSASVQAGESEEFRHFRQGVELICKQLDSVLEQFGVEAVATVGQPFDPHLHEAVALEESTDFAPDTVTEEMVRGYRLGDKLLRPAMVKVAK